MSTRDKLLKQMANNPAGAWKIGTLQSLAKQHGIEWRQPGTSHVTFRRQDGAKLTVPAHRPIKAVYIRQFLALITGEDHG